jgi:outer membrane protein TolC
VRNRLLIFFIALFFLPVDASAVDQQPPISKQTQEVVTGTLDEELSTSLIAKLQSYQQILDNSSKALSLNDALLLTFNNNPNLKYYKSLVESQYYQLYGSKLLWMPTLSFYNAETPSFGRLVSKTVSTSDDKTFTSNNSYSYLSPGAQINWNFIMPTRNSYINYNKKQLESSQFIYLTSVRNQLLTVQTAYYQVQANYKLIQQYNKIYNIELRQLKLIQERFKDRVVDLGSLGQTKSQFYLTLSQLIAYYNQYFSSVSTLASAIGIDDNTLILPSSELTKTGVWPFSLQDSLSNGLKFREEIKSNLSLAEAYGFNSQYYLRTYLPVLSLTGIAYYSKLSGESQNTNGNASTTSSSIGLNFSWTLFDGGVNYQLSRSQLALSSGYLQQAELEKNTVVQQIRAAYSQFVTSKSNLEATKRAYEAAQIGQEVSTVRFNYGVGSITTIVQSLQLLSQAASSYVQAIVDYNTSIASLYRYTSQNIPFLPNNLFEASIPPK